MTYAERFRVLFYRPKASFREAFDHPALLRTSSVIVIGTVVVTLISQYGLNKCVTIHHAAAYCLFFTLLWYPATLLSMGIFKAMGKRFSSESYVESAILAFFPFFTALALYFVPATFYYLYVADPPRTIYQTLVYCDDWIPLALLGGIGLIWTFSYLILLGRQVVGIRKRPLAWLVSFIVWVISFMVGLYIAYLLFRGWL